MLQSEEQENILKYFPNIEMCFETIIHNTFPAQPHDYVIAIPEGKKYFAWFTTYKNQHVCFLLEISKNKQICNIEIIYTSFHTQLAYETILYGNFIDQKTSAYEELADRDAVATRPEPCLDPPYSHPRPRRHARRR